MNENGQRGNRVIGLREQADFLWSKEAKLAIIPSYYLTVFPHAYTVFWSFEHKIDD